jgi:hypothetical protein
MRPLTLDDVRTKHGKIIAAPKWAYFQPKHGLIMIRVIEAWDPLLEELRKSENISPSLIREKQPLPLGRPSALKMCMICPIPRSRAAS